MARDLGQVVGAAQLVARPDGRHFLAIGDSAANALGPMVDAVGSQMPDTELFARLAEGDTLRTAALIDAGFAVDLVFEDFKVDFAEALRRMRRARVPKRFRLAHPHELDPQRCLALDNALRNDVPGLDGWRGDLAAWEAELAESPPYDPSGYLIAVDRTTEEYAGLVRFWRNADGPRLGLLGVTRPHRGTLLAAGLLHAGLRGAGEWGHDYFVTDASTSNPVTHRALVRLGAESLGRSHQLVRQVVG